MGPVTLMVCKLWAFFKVGCFPVESNVFEFFSTKIYLSKFSTLRENVTNLRNYSGIKKKVQSRWYYFKNCEKLFPSIKRLLADQNWISFFSNQKIRRINLLLSGYFIVTWIRFAKYSSQKIISRNQLRSHFLECNKYKLPNISAFFYIHYLR